MSLSILADQMIPLLDYFFSDVATIKTLASKDISNAQVKKANVLLIRSQTKVDQALLEGSHLQFMGSCVTGTDHIDEDYLKHKSISWYPALGCNTQAVVEYVLSIIAAMQIEGKLKQKFRVGIIGVGRIGRRLNIIFEHLGCEVILHDPIRAENEADFKHTALNDFANLDLISLHVPLTIDGAHPTYHLIKDEFLKSQKPGCIVLNTSRGKVLSDQVILNNPHLIYALDVWETEPNLNQAVMNQAYIATPHIAGHTVEAKQLATCMVYQAMAKLFGWPDKALPKTSEKLDVQAKTWPELILALRDPLLETTKMKTALFKQNARSFQTLREEYTSFHELGFYEAKFGFEKIWELK